MDSHDKVLNFAQVLEGEMKALGLNIASGVDEITLSDEAWRKQGLDAIRTEILKDGRKLTALCFSGGGIRSATFCLGVLQQLAKLNLLSKFDYLSTVSGGGFIGSWLKAWSLRDVTDENGNKSGTLGIGGVEKRLQNTAEEPRPVRLLRYYSNYLSPKIGLLSADTWTIASTYVRNLLLNWLVLIPLLMLPLLAPMMYLSFPQAISNIGLWHWSIIAIGILALGYSVMNLRVGLPSGTEKHRMSQEDFLGQCLGPLVVAVAALTVWWFHIQDQQMLDDASKFWGNCPWLSKVTPSRFFEFSSLLEIAVFFYVVAFVVETISFRRQAAMHQQEGNAYATPGKRLGAALTTAFVAAGLLWCWIQAFSSSGDPFAYVCFAVPALLAVFTLSEVFYIGVASYFTDEMDREFWARAGAWDLIVMFGWIALSTLALYGPMMIECLGPVAKGAFFGTGAAAGGFAAKFGHSALTSALADRKESFAGKLLSKLALPLAMLVFAIVLMTLLAYLAIWLLWAIASWGTELSQWANLISGPGDLAQLLGSAGAQPILFAAPFWIVLAAALVLALLQYAMGRVIHVNKFSLHAAYRNRIIRAYLGASRGRERKPNPFTGFDPDDNVNMTEFTPDEVKRPLHVINIALNLVRGGNLAWQERKAASFTASAFHCGGYDVGYRRTANYGGGQGMTLGTAVAISGAAFTPNAGYHSSPLLTFVMAFFNVRLGCWLGNPRTDAAKEPGPTHAAWPLVAETFGLTDDEHESVCLSDGGHFENLGLYEMVARRVRRIVVIDAGADPKYEFEDLGNAIRKIRADFGISIEREGPMKIARRVEGSAYCATFRIKYSDVHKIEHRTSDDIDGRLLYIKPALNKSEPQDVAQYSTTSNDFPHETTADQFYTESQFESYRTLGVHELKTIVDRKTVESIDELIALGVEHWQSAKP